MVIPVSSPTWRPGIARPAPSMWSRSSRHRFIRPSWEPSPTASPPSSAEQPTAPGIRSVPLGQVAVVLLEDVEPLGSGLRPGDVRSAGRDEVGVTPVTLVSLVTDFDPYRPAEHDPPLVTVHVLGDDHVTGGGLVEHHEPAIAARQVGVERNLAGRPWQGSDEGGKNVVHDSSLCRSGPRAR